MSSPELATCVVTLLRDSVLLTALLYLRAFASDNLGLLPRRNLRSSKEPAVLGYSYASGTTRAHHRLLSLESSSTELPPYVPEWGNETGQ